MAHCRVNVISLDKLRARFGCYSQVYADTTQRALIERIQGEDARSLQRYKCKSATKAKANMVKSRKGSVTRGLLARQLRPR